MVINSPEQLAILVRDYRKKHKISQQAIAEQFGLDQTTISAFENKPAATKLETLFRILAAMKLTIELQDRSEPDAQSAWTEEW